MKKKFWALCMAMCMAIITIFPSAGNAVYAAADVQDVQTAEATEDAVTGGTEDSYAGYVYFTVERSTLGQGFIVEPVKVGYFETDTLADITERVLGDMSTYEGSISDYYLEAVIDGGEPENWSTADIPQEITDAVTSAGGEISGRDKADRLAAYDYYSMSGWMFGINGTSIAAGAGSYVPAEASDAGNYTFEDGDVVRLQYTIYGWGADLNTCDPSWGTDPLIDFPDKDYLIKAVADETDKDKKSYGKAIEVLSDWDATSDEIAEAYNNLMEDEVIPNSLNESYAEILDAAVSKLHSTVTEPVSASTGGEWAVLSLSRYGLSDENWYHTYYENLVKQIETNGSAKLSNTKSTENSRAIIALTAIGANPDDVAGYNLLEPLTSMNYVTKQGINGAIYALIAIDSGNYTLPDATAASGDTLTTRDALIGYITDKALSGGGWSLTGDDADSDITAMAIQALSPYYDSNEEVKAAIDAALEVLSDMQLSDGSFLYRQGTDAISESNAESTAQVVLALCSLGINPETDDRFVKRGCSAIDALLSFYDEQTSSFCHVSEPDGMATEQALYALTAYDRLIKGKTGLYDMSDATDIYTADIKAENVTLKTTSMVCTGSKLEPAVTVTCNGRTLVKGVDYKLTYTNNVNPGTAYVTVTGIGCHKGTVKKSFTIGLNTPSLGYASNLKDGSKISWYTVKGAEGYYIYRKTAGGNYKYLAKVTGESSWYYVDKTAQQGVTYTYTVRAYKGSILSSYESQGKTVRRLAEPVLTVSNDTNGIAVNWSSIKGASGYLVYRKLANGGSWSRIATLAGNGKTSYTDTNVRNGVKYVYTVRAYYGSSRSSYYSGRIIYRLSQQNVRAVSSNSSGRLTLIWTKYLSASYYQVQYSLYSNMKNARTVNVSPNSTISKTITGLAGNRTYYVRVRCVRSTDGVTSVGAWSAVKSVKVKK